VVKAFRGTIKDNRKIKKLRKSGTVQTQIFIPFL
jgi:hypothetical protein